MPEKVKIENNCFRRGSVYMAKRLVNGVDIEQRMHDGFINATAMCAAHEKDLTQWFRTKETMELFVAVAAYRGMSFNPVDLQDLDLSRLSGSKYERLFPRLILSRRGSPGAGGGTWLHPDLAMQLAQKCSAPFALQVSLWIQEWITSAYNPIQLEADADRVTIRDDLGKVKRLELTDQVKAFMEKAGKYDLNNPKTGFYFSSVHDKLNKVITGETAKQMRLRLESELGKPVSQDELIRDYFPIKDLVNYASLCQVATNEMDENGTDPFIAIDIAAKRALSSKFVPKPIVFTERIDLVRRRLEQRDQILLGGLIPVLGEVA